MLFGLLRGHGESRKRLRHACLHLRSHFSSRLSAPQVRHRYEHYLQTENKRVALASFRFKVGRARPQQSHVRSPLPLQPQAMQSKLIRSMRMSMTLLLPACTGRATVANPAGRGCRSRQEAAMAVPAARSWPAWWHWIDIHA